MTKRRVYGAISLEDYQAVLDAVERRKKRTAGNGSSHEIEDPTSKPSLWARLRKTPKWVLIVLLIASCYSMGATWRWGGRGSGEMDMEQLTFLAQDPSYPDDRARSLVGRIDRKIRAGFAALGTIAERDTRSASFARENLRRRVAQAQEILSRR